MHRIISFLSIVLLFMGSVVVSLDAAPLSIFGNMTTHPFETNKINPFDQQHAGITLAFNDRMMPLALRWRNTIGAGRQTRTLASIDGRGLIAAIAFGSPAEKTIETFEHFRDRFLLTHDAGRFFVDWYYEKSPAWANTLAQHDGMKKTLRVVLAPAYFFALVSLNWNTQATLMAVLILLMWPMGKRKLAWATWRRVFWAIKKAQNKTLPA